MMIAIIDAPAAVVNVIVTLVLFLALTSWIPSSCLFPHLWNGNSKNNNLKLL